MQMNIIFRVEEDIKFLMEDPDFKRKVFNAYLNQVEANGGWGFTVKHKGYRVRFDLKQPSPHPLVRVYEGYAEEKPATQQTKILESA